MNGHTSVTHEDGAGHPTTVTNEDNAESACDMVLLDRQVTTDEVANYIVMVLPMKSSTTDLGFIKYMQDGLQSNSQCCINKCPWTSVNIWTAMVMK
jgi:hypothetical protein